MGLFHFEMQDDADGVSPWYTVTEPTPKYLATEQDVDNFIKAVNEKGVVLITDDYDFVKHNYGIVVPKKHAIDLYDLAKKVQARDSVGYEDEISNVTCQTMFLYWRKGISGEEYMAACHAPLSETDIINQYGRKGTYSGTIVPAEEVKSNEILLEMRMVATEDGKLKLIRKYVYAKCVPSRLGPFRYRLEREEVTAPFSEWWYPVRDSFDEMARQEWLNPTGFGAEKPRVYDAGEIPAEDTLKANTEKYETEMLDKIKTANESSNAFILTDDKKGEFWFEKKGRQILTDMGYRIFKKGWNNAITKANDPLEIAKILGYAPEKCSLTKPEKMSGKNITITRDGITAVIYNIIDLKKDNAAAFGGIDTVYFRKEQVYTATREAIVARFRELNVDKYEVNKLTQLWHYTNFSRAIEEVLNMGSDYGWELDFTELRFLCHVPVLDAKWVKRRWRDARKSSKLTLSEWVENLEGIKKVAAKLGFAGRDPGATVDAIEDYAEKQRQRYLDSLSR